MSASHVHDHLIACAKAVQPLVDEITSAPVRVQELQTELDRLSAEVTTVRTALASERTAWQIEWRGLRDAGDLDQSQRSHEIAGWVAKLDEAEVELRRVQAQCAVTAAKLENIAKVMRRVERMHAEPSAGASGLPAAMAELAELVRR